VHFSTVEGVHVSPHAKSPTVGVKGLRIGEVGLKSHRETARNIY